ncbi:MAG: aminotransferase class IV [Deltaproteobacteria bacterium]|nr:MAG: aminotransferase class IV [Deltaproteobacteria bacterium]
MAPSLRQCWVDGRLQPIEAPALRADDFALCEGRGCFTTARVRSGRPVWLERHVERVCRDAAGLGLGPLDPEMCRRALVELSAAAFGAGDGVLRLHASRDGYAQTHLFAVPRALPAPKAVWSAQVSASPHPGPGPACTGAKTSSRLVYALALEAAERAGADEAVLIDASGHVVEGAVSNLFWVGADGVLATPPLSRGAVAGVTRAVARERDPAIPERDVRADAPLRELIAVNAVRGAVPIVRLDDRPVGDGRAGPGASHLAELLARD